VWREGFEVGEVKWRLYSDDRRDGKIIVQEQEERGRGFVLFFERRDEIVKRKLKK